MKRRLAVAALTLTAWLAVGPQLATADAAQDTARFDRHAAARVVHAQTGDRVLAVMEVMIDGRRHFRVKLLTRDGVVRFVLIRAGEHSQPNR